MAPEKSKVTSCILTCLTQDRGGPSEILISKDEKVTSKIMRKHLQNIIGVTFSLEYIDLFATLTRLPQNLWTGHWTSSAQGEIIMHIEHTYFDEPQYFVLDMIFIWNSNRSLFRRHFYMEIIRNLPNPPPPKYSLLYCMAGIYDFAPIVLLVSVYYVDLKTLRAQAIVFWPEGLIRLCDFEVSLYCHWPILRGGQTLIITAFIRFALTQTISDDALCNV